MLNCLTENVVSLIFQFVETRSYLMTKQNLLNTLHKTSGSKEPIKQP